MIVIIADFIHHPAMSFGRVFSVIPEKKPLFFKLIHRIDPLVWRRNGYRPRAI
jgi:hypothetical protein